MYKLTSTTVVATCLSSFICSSALALDARTAALGGSAIANGQGVYGALDNPASLMKTSKGEKALHLHLGASTDVRDNARIAETAIDEKSLPDDIQDELDALENLEVTCGIQAEDDDVCLSGLKGVADLSERILDILERFDQQPLNLTATANFGVAYSALKYPVALHYNVSATGAATTFVADSDKDYLNTFIDVLGDERGELTFGELNESVPLNISENGQTVSVQQPEDVLQTEGEGSVLTREQLGISVATSVDIRGHSVDLGMTPKFSELKAASIKTAISEYYEDGGDALVDRFESNEAVTTTWNIDLGASTKLKDKPITVSAVIRNLKKETITTKEDFTFTTTPQLITGAAFSLSKATISADIALNKAKTDNMESQIMAIGVESVGRIFVARAGISHDTARKKDTTALSLGFSVGPLHIGGRLTSQNAAQAGAQLAFSF